ncbi:MAG TPA: hypothetical protein VNC16_10805 [Solirubrobacterales bacterium]|jgi:hypothetical protein|nr:hypothetical protein [Solirubrobacterales bacterium]
MAMVLVALVGVGSATAEKPVTVEAGNLEFTFDGGFAPKKLPKKKMAPITLSASGEIETKDGIHPPALTSAIVETDKNGAVFVKGLPVCKSGKLQSRTTAAAKNACPKSIIGSGKTTVEVQFPEQKPILVNSALTVFNGGQRGGTTTFYIHAFFTAPISGAIVTTVKIKKIHSGRYGLKSVATIPKIANGSGSVLSFDLKIGKRYTYKGKKVSVLSARCADGKLQARASALFADGTKASADIIRTCTPQG